MDKISEITKLNIFRLLDDDLPIKDFEQWVYKSNVKLETELPPDIYLDLISFNYTQKDNFKLLTDIINRIVDIDEFNLWRTKKLLNDIIENKIDLVVATRKLRQLYFATGESFIPITLGIGYESELDDVPIPSEYALWDNKALNTILEKVDRYKKHIIRDARQFLDTLEKGE